MDKKKLEKLELMKARGLAEQNGELRLKLHDLEGRISYLEGRLNEAAHALASECEASGRLDRVLNGDASGLSLDLEAFVEVQEDWYGNFKLKDDARYSEARFVHVFFLQLRGSAGDEDRPERRVGAGWRVGVWGNDDTGLEKDFPPEGRKDAVQLYVDIVTKRFPTKGWLRLKGLEQG